MPQIPALPPITAPDGPDQFPIDDTSVATTKRMSLTQLSTWLQSLFINLIDAGINLFTIRNETMFNHIVSGGCVLIGTGYGSTRNWSLSSGVVYINGKRFTVAAATGTATASRDTYFDLLEPALGTVATLVNTAGNIVTNNAASPTLAPNSVRMGIIVTGAANILSVASINQGQINKLLPINASIPYSVADSLGNVIFPSNPSGGLVNFKNFGSGSGQTTASASYVNITGLNCAIRLARARKLKITLYSRSASNNTAGAALNGAINDGSTEIMDGVVDSGVANRGAPLHIVAYVDAPAGLTTFTGRFFASGGGTASLSAFSFCYLSVEIA